MTTNTSISVTLTPELRLEQALMQAGIEKLSKVTQLSVTGTLTNDDFKYIRKKMSKTLKELDMSKASVENNTIGYKTFSAGLTSVIIPDSITSIDDFEFGRLDKLINITVCPNNLFYSSENGVFFNKDKTEILKYPHGRQEEHYDIPNLVACIGFYAFHSSKLNSIAIPDSVKKIEEGAFYSSKLTSISIPNSIKEIDKNAFEHCCNLTSIHIPDSIKEIGHSVFGFCENLTSVNIPNSIIKIGSFAFHECKRLTTLTIPDSVTIIEYYAFYGCKMLSSFTISDSIKEIRGDTFKECYRMASLLIPASVTRIDESAFDLCFNLTITVHSDNPVYSSENGVLFNKDKTELIRYPVKQFGDYTIPHSVKKIGRYAFSECSRLTSITIPNSVTEIEYYAFKKCTGLTAIAIPDSITEINLFAFSDCPAFITVHADNPVYKSTNGELCNKSAIT